MNWELSPAGWDPTGATGGLTGRRRAGLSFVRGFARRGRDSRSAAPFLSLSRGRGFPSGLGARGMRGGVGLLSRAPGVLAQNRAEAPPSVPRSPILSAAPSLSARVAPFPCLRRGSASALLPWALCFALPGFQGGCPGGAARRCGKGERAARQPNTSSEQRASGPRGATRGRRARPRPARAEPFVPSQKFACRDRDSCGRGGRRDWRRRRRRIEAAA